MVVLVALWIVRSHCHIPSGQIIQKYEKSMKNIRRQEDGKERFIALQSAATGKRKR